MGISHLDGCQVDFTRHKNLAVAAAPLIVATGLGVKGLTVAGMNISGIALGTVLGAGPQYGSFPSQTGNSRLSGTRACLRLVKFAVLRRAPREGASARD